MAGVATSSCCSAVDIDGAGGTDAADRTNLTFRTFVCSVDAVIVIRSYGVVITSQKCSAREQAPVLPNALMACFDSSAQPAFLQFVACARAQLVSLITATSPPTIYGRTIVRRLQCTVLIARSPGAGN